MKFCNERENYEIGSDVVRYGSEFDKTIRDVERIVEEARMKVQHKCEELEYTLDGFIAASAEESNDSYLKSNLLLGEHYVKM